MENSGLLIHRETCALCQLSVSFTYFLIHGTFSPSCEFFCQYLILFYRGICLYNEEIIWKYQDNSGYWEREKRGFGGVGHGERYEFVNDAQKNPVFAAFYKYICAKHKIYKG